MPRSRGRRRLLAINGVFFASQNVVDCPLVPSEHAETGSQTDAASALNSNSKCRRRCSLAGRLPHERARYFSLLARWQITLQSTNGRPHQRPAVAATRRRPRPFWLLAAGRPRPRLRGAALRCAASRSCLAVFGSAVVSPTARRARCSHAAAGRTALAAVSAHDQLARFKPDGLCARLGRTTGQA